MTIAATSITEFVPGDVRIAIDRMGERSAACDAARHWGKPDELARSASGVRRTVYGGGVGRSRIRAVGRLRRGARLQGLLARPAAGSQPLGRGEGAPAWIVHGRANHSRFLRRMARAGVVAHPVRHAQRRLPPDAGRQGRIRPAPQETARGRQDARADGARRRRDADRPNGRRRSRSSGWWTAWRRFTSSRISRR